MMQIKTYMWTLLCLTSTRAMASGLRLAAFNIRIFGTAKADKNAVMGYLALIIMRYDIILIQEIRDDTGTAITKLMARIKSDHNIDMELVISQREGRSPSKEQYAYLYRADLDISVSQQFTEDQAWRKYFERPPFIVRFCDTHGEVKDFTLVGLHAKPSEAVLELRNLTLVYNGIRDTWKMQNIIILGDLNADCTYVPKKSWPTIPIRNDQALFLWPINDGVATSLSVNCAYDRFIITGKALQNALFPESPKPFNFTAEYSLTRLQALDISDHYPIELELKKQKNQKRSLQTCNVHGDTSGQDVITLSVPSFIILVMVVLNKV